MNSSTTTIPPVFDTWQVALLPLLGGLICPLLSWLVYRVSLRRLKQKETTKSRAHVFYRILSGVLLAQFLCHTAISASIDLKYMFYFILAGYFLMDCAEAIGRIWNTNSNYIAPLDEQVPEDIGLNRETMQEQSIAVATNVSSNDFSNMIWTLQDYSKGNRKSQWLLGLLLVVFCIIVMVDGLLLIVYPQSIAAFVSFFVNGVSMSVAVYGAMIHAKFHVEEERMPRIAWWCLVTGIWCVTLVCSTIFVLTHMNVETALGIVNNKILLSFYGAAGGCVLKLQQYYHNRKVEEIDRAQTWLGMGVFFVAIAQGVATSIFVVGPILAGP